MDGGHDMNVPLHQRALIWLIYASAGFIAFGTLLDAVSNAITLITPLITYVASSVLVSLWLFLEIRLNKRGLKWIVQGGEEIRIRKLGLRPRLAFLGIVMLLWTPWLVYVGGKANQSALGLHFNDKALWTSKLQKDRTVLADVYTIHIYNVDDIADLYINEKVHYKVQWGYQGYDPNWFPFVEYGPALVNSKPGDSQVIDITSDLQPGDNTLRLTLRDSGIAPGAASLSMSGKKNGQELIREIFSIPHYTIPRKTDGVYERVFHIQYDVSR
jgi:hypothetical protein